MNKTISMSIRVSEEELEKIKKQRQIYRYINGSSGQVEIYPQDIARIWIKPATDEKIEQVYKKYQKACRTHDKFYRDLLIALDEV